ncbi:ABC transporter substrate-binding protein [Pseudomonas sp. CC120222-01a]|uniref:substrate-binding periplasmic protein n=1 Tax=Pseudomonas sp. CC120222-01a TaxID=1378075 RepID=UPI000D9471E2|nr:transporter substrate-binding domain-containing protein [Pseudomonas sp. CC120222-01a]PVZ39896.1 polar amino acid transport system substrate-binding protein [Pseudomonas sp. CC120222-01a]
MIERSRCRSLLLSLFMLLMPEFAAAEALCGQLTATGNPEYPPYLWRDPNNPDQLIGANADLLNEVGEALGLEVKVVYGGPWSRAQEEVRTGRIDLMAGYFLTHERQQQMDFVSPAFLHVRSVVWVRQDGGFPYHDWADLKGHNGGTLVSNSHGQQFDDYARANLQLEAVPSARQAFEKLLHKRNDYLIYEQYPGMALAGTQGWDTQLKVLDPPVSSEGLYLALSHQSKCNRAELRERLAQKMKELVAGPVPEQLVEKNLELWRQQQAGGKP